MQGDSRIQVDAIHRFPVKSFSGEQLASVTLNRGKGIPFDRQFAVLNGSSQESPLPGEWVKARTFLINTLVDGLLRYRASVDDDSAILTVTGLPHADVSIDLDSTGSLCQANEAIAKALPSGEHTAPRFVRRSREKGYWDYPDSDISIINLETVRLIEQKLGRDVDPVRFRGNLVISGLPPWHEFGWIGRRICVGEAELEGIRPANRCAATSVNPTSTQRDLKLPEHLMEVFGHGYCGVYARVVRGGVIRTGDSVAGGEISGLRYQDACPDNAPAFAFWPRLVRVTESHENDRSTVIDCVVEDGWPFAEAQADRKMRVHYPSGGWHTARTVSQTSDRSVGCMRIEKVNVTEQSPETAVSVGQRIVISGPYGKTR